MMPRLALALGGVVAVAMTPVFALSFFLSYGVPDETPPGWLERWQDPLTDAGLLDGSYSLYDRYGLLYFAAWVLALSGLAVLVNRRRAHVGPRQVRAWRVIIGSLAVTAVGILGDYGAPTDVLGFIGFVLTNLGLFGAAVGCVLLGRALRREADMRLTTATAVGGVGLVSIVGGMALVGHIPSGPGLGYALAAIALGAAGLPTRSPLAEPT